MSYALTVASRSILSGTLLTSIDFPAGFDLLIGMAVIGLIIRFVGKSLVTANPVRQRRIGMLRKRLKTSGMATLFLV